MNRMINSDQFRKHPTGGVGLIKILKFLFLIGSIIGVGMVIASIFFLFKSDVSLIVVAKKSLLPDVERNGFQISNVSEMGLIKFKVKGLLDWVLIPRSNRLDLYSNIFSLLITWQLFKIANEINMEKPFLGNVVKRLQYLQQLVIAGWLVTGLIWTYTYFAVRELTKMTYTIGSFYNLVSPGYLTLGTWLIVLLFSYVYKRGVVLQQEQDLTI